MFYCMIKRMRNKLDIRLGLSLAAFFLFGLIGVLYFATISVESDDDLYRLALIDAMSDNDNSNYYASFDLETDDTRIRGEVAQDFATNDSYIRADVDLEVAVPDSEVSILAKIELNQITKFGEEPTLYYRYKDMTTSDGTFSTLLDKSVDPVRGKWVLASNTDEQTDEGEAPTSIRDGGTLALLSSVRLFYPTSVFGAEDQSKYLDAVDKYSLFEILERKRDTKFRGVLTEQFTVRIDKSALREFESETIEALSKYEGYEKIDTVFLDELFGASNSITAQIYVEEGTHRIIGIEYELMFEVPITEQLFDTDVYSVKFSLLHEYDRDFLIEAPKQYMSEEEFDTLFSF